MQNYLVCKLSTEYLKTNMALQQLVIFPEEYVCPLLHSALYCFMWFCLGYTTHCAPAPHLIKWHYELSNYNTFTLLRSKGLALVDGGTDNGQCECTSLSFLICVVIICIVSLPCGHRRGGKYVCGTMHNKEVVSFTNANTIQLIVHAFITVVNIEYILHECNL